MSELGHPDDALRTAEQGLDLLDASRDIWPNRWEYFDLRHKYYRHRLDLAMAAVDPLDAWRVFDRYRAQGLVQNAAMRASPSTVNSNTARSEARGLNGQIESEELVLAFADGVDKIHVLTLTPGQPPGSQTLEPRLQEISSRVARLVKSLDPDAGKDNRRLFGQAVDSLSRDLLGPLAEILDGSQPLTIIAGHTLEKLPFEILRSPRTGQPLIEDHPISYLPSLSFLDASRTRTQACAAPEYEFFGMGDPVFGPGDDRWPKDLFNPRTAGQAFALPRLPDTAREISGISRLYPQDSLGLLGLDATRQRFETEAPQYRIIHIASHAQSDPKVPELSKISLSRADSNHHSLEDSDLSFEHIANLDLCGQIVVLSACETAAGRSAATEGILGLPRAFLHAGASTVVASLWRVPDEFTADLMLTFYTHLRQTGDPANALQQAKLEMIRAGHPRSSWTAFVLLGDSQIGVSSSTFPTQSGPIY